MRRLFGLGLAVAAAACSLSIGDGFTKGSAASGPDADADAASPIDGADGGLGPPAPPAGGTFCATKTDVMFCDDFDSPSRPFATTWEQRNFDADTTFKLAANPVRSGPSSLEIFAKPSANPTLGAIGHEMLFTTSMTDLTYELDVWLEVSAVVFSALFPVFLYVSGIDNVSLRIDMITEDGHTKFQEEEALYAMPNMAGSFNSIPAAPPIGEGRWVHVARHIELGTKLTSTLMIDGVIASILDLDPRVAKINGVMYEVGAQYTNAPSPPLHLWVDNVTFTAH